ncbi:hypothetical protein Cantr_00366 [Candida viswanathii]|uniref:HTH La-type RNA-binding domain-containing protein n=1 Tax=Candida viswanathii TaxID=5486 RepID=A0A367YGE5_9ASCO|nr:hypothetical protein Cantr_00366 [Candida viswanathii]
MSTFKRLLPAPPPTINAWSINQLINITDNNSNTESSNLAAAKINSSDSEDSFSSDEDIEIISGHFKSISSPQSPTSSIIKESTTALTVPFLAPISDKLNSPVNIRDAGHPEGDVDEVLVSVGKYTKIKKPKFPKSNKIKGGSGHYKYRITDNTKDSPPYIINTTNPSYSDHSPDYHLTTPPPALVESAATSPLIHTPLPPPAPQAVSAPAHPHLFPPSPSVVVYPQFGIPIYHVSVLGDSPTSAQPQPLSSDFQSPVSPKSSTNTKKESIKRQIEYYFSTENLCKDTYLRSLFNKNDGSIKLEQLLEFNRMKILTKNGKYTNLLLESIEEIPVLEMVHNDRTSFRLKNWQTWVI